MPGALVVAALIPLLPRGVTAVCMPFQDLDDAGAEAVVQAAMAAGMRLRFVMLSRNNISDEARERLQLQLPTLDQFHLRVNARGG